jgi:predicted hotdog family 3-hydroxylacyl-ACP dehydratase
MSLAVENLLPHRAPMRWLDELIECTETTARGTVHFDAGHFAVADGRILETALVECIAQTIAAAQSQRARMRGGSGKPSIGMLAAVANFKIHSPPPLEKLLEIEINELKKFGPMLLVAGNISCEGQLIADGELTVYA